MQTTSHYIQLMFYKSYAELRAEATRAYLGFLWWFLEPMLYLAIFYLIFETGLRRGGPEFAPFLLCGLVPWKWFSSTVLGSASVLSRNSGIIQQVYLPKVLLPGVVLISNSFKFLLVLAILLIFLTLIMGKPVSIAWTALPLLMLVQLGLIAGFGVLAAAVIPLAQDLKLLLDNLMMMAFFASGIFFDIGSMTGKMKDILMLNPMAVMIDSYRTVLLENTWPAPGPLGWVCFLAALSFVAGIAMLVKFDRVYPKLVAK